jgi:hypothetical protein
MNGGSGIVAADAAVFVSTRLAHLPDPEIWYLIVTVSRSRSMSLLASPRISEERRPRNARL